ncbi:MAG: hypothetical protein ACLTBV_08425 [Enterocloster bolteae]
MEARSTNPLDLDIPCEQVSRSQVGGPASPKEAYRELEEIKDSCQYKKGS